MIKFGHTVGSLNKRAGGPSRSVTELCEAFGRLGGQVDLVSVDCGSDPEQQLLPSRELVGTTLVKYAVTLPGGRRFCPNFGRALSALLQSRKWSLIHDHGLWLPSNHSSASIARRYDVPLIVSPRGMLEPWALRHRKFKKGLAWRLYQARDLHTARLLHATADQEAENLRRCGLRQPIAVIPNGVDVPLRLAHTTLKARNRYALFLSRIHPVKGLSNLIEAWALVCPPGWRLVIAGPDEGGHSVAVKAQIRALGLVDVCDLVGAVDGEAKAALYRRAGLFILPSLSENFGMVVAEALAQGLPVIATRGAPWKDLEIFRCGWWVEIGVQPLADALRVATSLCDAERAAMGERGRTYVERYNWDAIAAEMLAVYHWLLGQSERPSCVRCD